MIERDAFQYWMGCIADRTNRVLAPPTYQEYYKALVGELTNDEFVEAARLVFRNAQFWPSPKDFIDAIKPDARAYAARIFEWIRSDARHFDGVTHFWIATEIQAEHGAPALAAFRAIGGGERFRSLEAKDLPFALKEFADAYVRASTDAAKPPDRKALPSSSVGVQTFHLQ